MERPDEIFLFSFLNNSIYRNNPFRVLGLTTDATTREIKRRAEEIGLQGRLSDSKEKKGPKIDTGRDPRKASRQLLDPQVRMVYEIFWFWSKTNPHESDEKLDIYVQHEELERAKVIWESWLEVDEGDYIAQHNLAVLHHMYALEMGRQSRDGHSPDGSTTLFESYWSEALRYWSLHLADPRLREHLGRRFDTLDDPRLDDSFLNRTITELPIAILTLLAQQIPIVLRAGNASFASIYTGFLKDSPFDEYPKSRARQLVTEPICRHISDLCERSMMESKANRNKAMDLAKDLLTDARLKAELATISLLLGEGDAKCIAIRDMFANCIYRCVVTYVNKTNDWVDVSKILGQALEIAIGANVKSSIRGVLAQSYPKTGEVNKSFTQTKTNRFQSSGIEKHNSPEGFRLPRAAQSEVDKALRLAREGDFNQAIQLLEILFLRWPHEEQKKLIGLSLATVLIQRAKITLDQGAYPLRNQYRMAFAIPREQLIAGFHQASGDLARAASLDPSLPDLPALQQRLESLGRQHSIAIPSFPKSGAEEQSPIRPESTPKGTGLNRPPIAQQQSIKSHGRKPSFGSLRTIAFGAFIIWMLFSLISTGKSQELEYVYITNTPNSVVVIATEPAPSASAHPTLTKTLRPTRTSTPRSIRTTTSMFSGGVPGCVRWDEVGWRHVGRTICVYGRVVNIRDDGRTFSIEFSHDWNDFKIQDWNFYFTSLKVGDCISATGTVIDNVSFLALLRDKNTKMFREDASACR